MDIKTWIKIETKLRETRWIRILCKPWKDWELRYKRKKYLKSGYGEELKKFKNMCQGKRCFIIGNGPSLKAEDLDRLKDEYTFSANRIYEMFNQTQWRPWSYVVVDTDILRTDQENILKVPSMYKFLSYKERKYYDDVPVNWIVDKAKFPINVASDTTAYISEDITRGLSRGWTVTFISIQLAIYMGFKEIYLLGVDFNYSHYVDKNGKIHQQEGVKDYFDGIKNDAPSCMIYEVNLHAYKKSREYCDTHGITIKNATRGGKLEVFERVDFDDLFR